MLRNQKSYGVKMSTSQIHCACLCFKVTPGTWHCIRPRRSCTTYVYKKVNPVYETHRTKHISVDFKVAKLPTYARTSQNWRKSCKISMLTFVSPPHLSAGHQPVGAGGEHPAGLWSWPSSRSAPWQNVSTAPSPTPPYPEPAAPAWWEKTHRC